jgi:mono/diheme cytochrome c family protein
MGRWLAVAAGMMLMATTWADEPQCPQPRFTGSAPESYLALENPVPLNRAVLREGRRLYLGNRDTRGCAICHGNNGDGRGPLAASFNPPPRNFTCARTINDIPDGQLFWIIRYGSPDTSMPAHPELRDSQIWQLVHELRRLAR